jgi:hypothetical protein
MTQEEKAKAYDKALDKAKKELDACSSQDCNAARQIFRLFPEFVESEDEKIRKSLTILLQHFCKGYRVLGLDFPVSYKDMLAWLEKQGEQKPIEWTMDNVEELTEFENAMMHIGGSFFGQHAGLDPNDTNAIKEQANILLGLVPKQEWSEEDEKTIVKMRDFFIRVLGDKPDFTEDKRYEEFIEFIDNRLKSLRPQSQWMPSERQMEVLDDFLFHIPKEIPEKVILVSLLNDLKKLRKE